MKHTSLHTAVQYLGQTIEGRLQAYFNPQENRFYQIRSFHFQQDCSSRFYQFMIDEEITTSELLILLLALVPNILPGFLDDILKKYIRQDDAFPLFGGYKGKSHRGILPTAETGLFLLAGNSLVDRLHYQNFFLPSQRLFKKGILLLGQSPNSEPSLSSPLILSKEYVNLFLFEKEYLPNLSMDFPAKRITTSLEKSDIVLNSITKDAIEDIEVWVGEHHKIKEWSIQKYIKPGYRALFYGPSGVGKTLTASILGKQTGLPVFRIDLSMVISKYIGETEQNLSNLFKKAEDKNWILFFDEADALFGKRTGVRNAHDKYANQEVSYLLQRIEDYNGLVILSSNMKDNIDNAFLRRFQSIIHFPIPNKQERYRLWKKMLPKEMELSGEIGLDEISQYYELTGASISNIVAHCCLQLVKSKTEILTSEILNKAIATELRKENGSIVN